MDQEAYLESMVKPHGIIRRPEPIAPFMPFPKASIVFQFNHFDECRKLRNALKTKRKKNKKERTQLSTLNWILTKKEYLWLHAHGFINALGFLVYGSSFEPISARYFHSNNIVFPIDSPKAETESPAANTEHPDDRH
ncbi:unnamed protein product [Bursaphelenchus okinawaensis]|uniref:Uncharacterized protein n=1 Tax=Bursaphelenchus okinawaensis TaxID=465554 RepID=A0A811KAV5_9BILA|nr:unnamed protein product [Bursaphelenchus okinawaensis]CAG9098073.1 unnamed protein product [Bursaphelenchus okinawaensis]